MTAVPFATVLDGVRHQVVEGLFDLALVSLHRPQGLRNVEFDGHRPFVGVELQGGPQAPQQRQDGDFARGLCVLLEFDPRERQQVLHEVRHPFALFVHHPQEHLARHGIVPGRAQQGFDAADERCQGGADFVAGIGHEVDSHLLGPAGLGHVVADRHQGGPVVRPDGQRRDVHGIEPVDTVPCHDDLGTGCAGAGKRPFDGVIEPRIPQDPGEMLSGRHVAKQPARGTVEINDLALPRQQHKRIGKRVEQEFGLAKQLRDALVPLAERAVCRAEDGLEPGTEWTASHPRRIRNRVIAGPADPRLHHLDIADQRPGHRSTCHCQGRKPRQGRLGGQPAGDCQDQKHPCFGEDEREYQAHVQSSMSIAARAAMLSRSLTVAPRRTIWTGFSRPSRIGPITRAPSIASTSR